MSETQLAKAWGFDTGDPGENTVLLILADLADDDGFFESENEEALDNYISEKTHDPAYMADLAARAETAFNRRNGH